MEDQIVLGKRIQQLRENEKSYDVVVPPSDEIEVMRKFVWDHYDAYQFINHDSDFKRFVIPICEVFRAIVLLPLSIEWRENPVGS